MPLPQLTPLVRREVDVVVGLDKPEAGRFVARKLTDYALGVYASVAYLGAMGEPRTVEDLKRRRLIGYVEEHAFSTPLDYVRELFGGAPTLFECASATTQVEAVRAGVGLGVAGSSRGGSRIWSGFCPSRRPRAPTGLSLPPSVPWSRGFPRSRGRASGASPAT